MERAIIKALERQYSDILTPLRDSIPKKIGIQVQKLARRQSTTHYSIPSQVCATYAYYLKWCPLCDLSPKGPKLGHCSNQVLFSKDRKQMSTFVKDFHWMTYPLLILLSIYE